MTITNLEELTHDHVPLYEHDCNQCKFLGNYIAPTTKEKVDLYFCPQDEMLGPTIIARFGSDDPAYSSGIEFGRNPEEPPSPLRVAYLRAKMAGYIKDSD